MEHRQKTITFKRNAHARTHTRTHARTHARTNNKSAILRSLFSPWTTRPHPAATHSSGSQRSVTLLQTSCRQHATRDTLSPVYITTNKHTNFIPGHHESSSRSPRVFPQVTTSLPQGHHESSPRSPRVFPQVTMSLLPGHHESSPRSP